MRVLVTGGTGFIGTALIQRLRARGEDITVYCRNAAKAQKLLGNDVTLWTDFSAWKPEVFFDAVINLAGEPIIDRPWTEKRKQQLCDSRIGLTERLLAAIAGATRKPEVLLSGSAVGYYGNTADVPCTESFPAGSDFPARLCQGWERSALQAEALDIRTVVLRTGLVLHADGGLLKKMQLPFRCGLGSQLGNGRQMMPWIHRNDYLDALVFLMDNPDCWGAYNMTAPQPVSNREFTRQLAESLHRPALLKAPAWLLKAGLGERSALVLDGQQALPERLLQAGFAFKYATLDVALRHAGVN